MCGEKKTAEPNQDNKADRTIAIYVLEKITSGESGPELKLQKRAVTAESHSGSYWNSPCP